MDTIINDSKKKKVGKMSYGKKSCIGLKGKSEGSRSKELSVLDT